MHNSARRVCKNRWGWLLVLVAVLGPGRGIIHIDGPPPAHTGGFGEPTCQTCHFGAPLNDPGGALTLTGLPPAYTAGESYSLTIAMHRPSLAVAGFQLATRFDDGEQAGTLHSEDISAQVTTAPTGVQYVHHSYLGVALTHPDTVQWSVRWHAPSDTTRPVYVHLTGNAGNGDNSPLSDFIYHHQAVSRSAH